MAITSKRSLPSSPSRGTIAAGARAGPRAADASRGRRDCYRYLASRTSHSRRYAARTIGPRRGRITGIASAAPPGSGWSTSTRRPATTSAGTPSTSWAYPTMSSQLQFGHRDGGKLVRTTYGHPDAAMARDASARRSGMRHPPRSRSSRRPDESRPESRPRHMVDAGLVSCARCGWLIHPGEPWDLGHVDDDRPRYSGPRASPFNRARAGRLTGRSRIW